MPLASKGLKGFHDRLRVDGSMAITDTTVGDLLGTKTYLIVHILKIAIHT